MAATDLDRQLLKTIHNTGGKATSSTLLDRMPYDRLVDLGWMSAQQSGAHTISYSLTPAGVAAAEEN